MPKSREILTGELKLARAEQRKLAATEKRKVSLGNAFDGLKRLVDIHGSVKDDTLPMKFRELNIQGIHMKNKIDAEIQLSYIVSDQDNTQVFIGFSDRNAPPDKYLVTRSYSIGKDAIKWTPDETKSDLITPVTDPILDKPLETVTQVLALAKRTMRRRAALTSTLKKTLPSASGRDQTVSARGKE